MCAVFLSVKELILGLFLLSKSICSWFIISVLSLFSKEDSIIVELTFVPPKDILHSTISLLTLL